jgi:hypothetical protein
LKASITVALPEGFILIEEGGPKKPKQVPTSRQCQQGKIQALAAPLPTSTDGKMVFEELVRTKSEKYVVN